MATFWKVIGVVVAIVVLRIAGIPWFWAMASVVGVVWAWSYLHATFPTHKRKISLAITILFLAAAFPFVYGYAHPYTWRSEAAGVRRLLYWDMWRAIKMDPPMLKSRLDLSNQNHWLQDQIGERHQNELARIRQDKTNGVITDTEAIERSLAVQNDMERYQQRATNVSARLISSDPVPFYPVCAGAQNQTFGPNQTHMQVPLQMDCWSGWIILPSDSLGNAIYRSWYYNTPGEVEFLLANGRRIHTINRDMFGWMPPDNRIRIRGKGPSATVEITR